MFLLCSENHPLAAKETIWLEDLEAYTELVHGDENYHKVNPAGDIAKRIYLYERGSQFDLLKNVPTTYMWVSPIPEEILNNNNLVQKKCSNSSVCFKDVLIAKSDYQFSAYASRFLESLQQVKGDMLKGNNECSFIRS